MDRIDLHVEVPSISLDELRSPSAESSESVRERVRKARQRQGGRIPSNGSPPVNAALEGKQIELHCSPDEEGRLLLERAYEKLGLSPRCVHRIMKVARTLADLEHEEGVRAPHIAEAVQYRAIRPHNE